MKTITCEVDDDTYNELAKFSATDGRPVEELASSSLWHSAARLRQPLRSAESTANGPGQNARAENASVVQQPERSSFIGSYRLLLMSVLRFMVIAVSGSCTLASASLYINTSSNASLVLFGVAVTFFLMNVADVFQKR